MYCIKIAFDKILSEPVFIGDSPKTFGSSRGRRFSKIGRIRMELRDIYTQLGGDYDVMLRRLRKDSTILMFLEEFAEDNSFEELETAMKGSDDKAAFEAAHTLKGVVLNMELGFLSKSVTELTDLLRGGRKPQADELFERVREDYRKTMDIIKKAVGD